MFGNLTRFLNFNALFCMQNFLWLNKSFRALPLQLHLKQNSSIYI